MGQSLGSLRSPAAKYLKSGSVRAQRSANLVNVSAMGPDRFVKLIARDSKFLRPVRDIRGHLGVDFLGVVGAFQRVLFMLCVRFVALGSVMMFRHNLIPHSWFSLLVLLVGWQTADLRCRPVC